MYGTARLLLVYVAVVFFTVPRMLLLVSSAEELFSFPFLFAVNVRPMSLRTKLSKNLRKIARKLVWLLLHWGNCVVMQVERFCHVHRQGFISISLASLQFGPSMSS